MPSDIAQLIIPAFFAGILTFLAPCTLPLVPGYLAFIGGVSPAELADPHRAKQLRRKIFLNGVMYVVGFSAVFIALGTLAGSAGSLLAQNRPLLARIGGVFVILFGLMMMGILKLPFLAGEHRFRVPRSLQTGSPGASFILGSAFAFGWTPCVGPLLGTIILLASASSTALGGAFLLFVFSLGLGAPFLLIALGIGSATRVIGRISKYLMLTSIIGGVLLIGLGTLLIFNKMPLLITYGFKLLQFINYERILDYL